MWVTLGPDFTYSRQLTKAGEWENSQCQILRGKLDFTSESELTFICLSLKFELLISKVSQKSSMFQTCSSCIGSAQGMKTQFYIIVYKNLHSYIIVYQNQHNYIPE